MSIDPLSLRLQLQAARKEVEQILGKNMLSIKRMGLARDQLPKSKDKKRFGEFQ